MSAHIPEDGSTGGRLVVRRITEPSPDLLAELQQYEFEAFAEVGLRTCDLAVVAKAGMLLAGYVGDELMGGCQLMRMVDEPQTFYVVGFYVRPSWQGRDLGRELLLAVAEKARMSGAEDLMLTVAQANKRALALYRRAGFVEQALVPDFYGRGEHRQVLRWRLKQGGLHGSV